MSHIPVSHQKDGPALALLAGTHWPIRDAVSDSGSVSQMPVKPRGVTWAIHCTLSQPFLNSLDVLNGEMTQDQGMFAESAAITLNFKFKSLDNILSSLKYLHILHNVENEN